MMYGKRVQFKTIEKCPILSGERGIVVGRDGPHWHVALENNVPGFYSGKAWAYEEELEVLD